MVKDKSILNTERNKYEEEWKNFAALPADMSSSNLEGDSKKPSTMIRMKVLNKFNTTWTEKKLHNSALKLEQVQSIESAKGLKPLTDSKATLMVMAIYLDTDMRQAATWSQY